MTRPSPPYYDAIRPEIVANGTGGIVLFSGDDFPGPAIRLVTGETASHVGVVLVLQGLSGPFVCLYESLPSGFVISSLSLKLRGYNGHAWWYPLKDEWRMDEQVRGIEDRIRKYEGTGYAWGDLIRMLITRPDIDTGRMICSEVVQVVAGNITTGPICTPQGVLGLGMWNGGKGLI